MPRAPLVPTISRLNEYIEAHVQNWSTTPRDKVRIG
jgi:hypothetical protein